MRAAICTRYGPPDVLEIRDVPKPVPRDDEVLVKVHASTVNSSDWFIRSGIPNASFAIQIPFRLMMGILRPRTKIQGLVFAGEIVEVGRRVRRFAVGDRVFAFTKFRLGGYAQFACAKERSTIGHAPASLSLEDAAAIPYGGLLAHHYLRKGGIQSGGRVLVYGASSAVGTAAIQLAKGLGARVTAVCGPKNIELARSLGADEVVDYTVQDAPAAGATWDLVLDAVGKRKTSAFKTACQKTLAARGRSISVDDGTPALPPEALEVLREAVDAGKLLPVIDRRYPLDRIVEAHRYVEQEHKKGSVVITMPQE